MTSSTCLVVSIPTLPSFRALSGFSRFPCKFASLILSRWNSRFPTFYNYLHLHLDYWIALNGTHSCRAPSTHTCEWNQFPHLDFLLSSPDLSHVCYCQADGKSTSNQYLFWAFEVVPHSWANLPILCLSPVSLQFIYNRISRVRIQSIHSLCVSSH